MARLEFSPKDRIALAKRVANRCSFPGCSAITSGPSDESDSAVSNTGTACHIISASQGPNARRNIPGTNPDDIRNINNGIWMCRTHGTLIDTDEVTYSVEMLRTWHKIAEFRAKYEQEQGKPLDFNYVRPSIPVVSEKLVITTTDDINRQVGELLINCCVPQIWGDSSNDAIRDLIIEIAINAIEHAQTHEVTIRVTPQRIQINYDSASFDPIIELSKSNRGGGKAMRHVLDSFSDQIIVTYKFEHENNELVIAVPNTSSDVLRVTPCSMALDNAAATTKVQDDFVRTEGCSVIYIVLPRFFGRSDMRKLKDILKEYVPANKRLVFIAEDISAGVAAQIIDEIKGANVIKLKGQ